MYPIKQSTLETVPFFAHDSSGDAITGLSDGDFTKRIAKSSGSAGSYFSAMTVVITEEEGGWYTFPLSTSHSDTAGLLTVYFTHSGGVMKQVNLQWRNGVRLLSDLAYPAVTGRSVAVESDGMIHADLKEWLSVAPKALVSQRVDTTVGAMQSGVLNAAAIASAAITNAKFDAGAIDATVVADNTIDAGAIAADAITSAKLAGSAITEIADGILTRQMTESYTILNDVLKD